MVSLIGNTYQCYAYAKFVLAFPPKLVHKAKKWKLFGLINSVHCETPITLLFYLMRLFFIILSGNKIKYPSNTTIQNLTKAMSSYGTCDKVGIAKSSYGMISIKILRILQPLRWSNQGKRLFQVNLCSSLTHLPIFIVLARQEAPNSPKHWIQYP